MTIKGFIDFVNSRPELKHPLQLRQTRLLMDGHHLQRQLYMNSSKAGKDAKFGTDYVSYAENIKRFLRRLRVCGVVPIVVFHGDVDPKKYMSGFMGEINEIRRTVEENYRNIRFQSPTLRNYVFNSVMREFKVDIIQTCSATWPQMAMLANALKCPIFSMRRDFFFLDVKYGIINDHSFIKSPLKYDQKEKFWYIPAKMICVDYLSKTYVGLKPEVLPLLAVVWEESLITQEDYKYLLENTRQCGRMDDVLNWIRGKSVDKALEEISKYLKSCEEGNEDVDQKIKQLMKRFESTDSLISRYLSNTESDKDSLKMLGKGDIEVTVPNWFAREYRKAIIRPAIMNIVKLKTHSVYPQMEDYSQESSWEHTREIRRFLYTILRTDPENAYKIKVLDRKGVDKFEEYIAPDYEHPLEQNQKMPYLGNLRLLDISSRRSLFLSVMEVNEEFINRCKVTLLMFDFFDYITDICGTTYLIVCLRYCIRHNANIEWRPYIGALLLSVMFYGRQEIQSDDKWLSIYHVGRTFSIKLVHYYALHQACLHMMNFVNLILGFPLDEGKPYFCLDGVFLYNATERLSHSSSKDEDLIAYLLKGSDPLRAVYDDMFELVVLDLDV